MILVQKWLSSQLKSGDEVGFDPTVVTYSAVRCAKQFESAVDSLLHTFSSLHCCRTWMRELKPHGIDVVPTENLVDKVRCLV